MRWVAPPRTLRFGCHSQAEVDMFRLSTLVLVHAMIVPFALPAHSQEVGPRTSLLKTGSLGLGVEPGLCSKSMLLGRPQIQKELEITDEQRERLKRAQDGADTIAQRQGQEKQLAVRRLQRQGDSE